MPTYEASKQGYTNLWKRAVVRPRYLAAARQWAIRINSGRTQYQAIQQATGVPWFFIGLLHMREGACNFNTYLGNGEPLNAVTHLVPAGRGPFKSFFAGAVDALQHQGFIGIKDWPISRILWAAEEFNGEGYFLHGVNSGYVWSWTNQYGTAPNIGKYTADGSWSPSEIDQQAGVAAVLGCLIVANVDIAATLNAYQEEPVTNVVTTIPVPTPTPAPTPSSTDWEATIIAMLKAAGKWPAAGEVHITTAGDITITVNGKQV